MIMETPNYDAGPAGAAWAVGRQVVRDRVLDLLINACSYALRVQIRSSMLSTCYVLDRQPTPFTFELPTRPCATTEVAYVSLVRDSSHRKTVSVRRYRQKVLLGPSQHCLEVFASNGRLQSACSLPKLRCNEHKPISNLAQM